VSPSGRLPSCLTNPGGSLVAEMLAEPKDRQMMSFRAWCLAILPGAFFAHHCMEALSIQLIIVVITSIITINISVPTFFFKREWHQISLDLLCC